MANRDKSLRSLGSDYVNDFFRGALFLDKEKNRVYKLLACERQGMATCSYVDLSDTLLNASWQGRELVNLYENDGGNFSLFSWPKMGYRNVPHSVLGNAIYYLTTERGTARGLRDDNIHHLRPAIAISISDYVHAPCLYDNSAAVRAYVVYNPTWYSYKEGMKKLLAGEWSAFALNEDLAISISYETPDTSNFDIYFRGVLAGSISEEGHIVMKNKILTRSSLQKLLNKDI